MMQSLERSPRLDLEEVSEELADEIASSFMNATNNASYALNSQVEDPSRRRNKRRGSACVPISSRPEESFAEQFGVSEERKRRAKIRIPAQNINKQS